MSLVHIVKLDLSKNELKQLPENFGELIKLRHLDLYKNELQHLPLSFGKLQALRWLDLKDNPLVPGVAQISGPCLDAKQCQTCARDVVKFYELMQNKIELERQLREAQRQKMLQLNAQKAKLEERQKKKKEKKDKIAKQEKNGQAVKEEILNEEKSLDTDAVQLANDTKNKLNSPLFRFLKFILLILIPLGLILFIFSIVKTRHVEFFESYVADAWNATVNKLPPGVQKYRAKVENNIAYLQVFVRESVLTVKTFVNDIVRIYNLEPILAQVADKLNTLVNSTVEGVRQCYNGIFQR